MYMVTVIWKPYGMCSRKNKVYTEKEMMLSPPCRECVISFVYDIR